MKALFIDPPGKSVLAEVERPSPRRGEIQVKMKACGVCGTDVEKVNGELRRRPILGHEAVGEVSALGDGVKVIDVGQRVFTHHHTPCYSCTLCKRGEYTLCEEYTRHNLNPCGFAEYYTVPSWNVEKGGVIELPDTLDYETASFAEPLACCIRGLEKVRIRNFSSAVIYGAGPVGLLHMKLARNYGVKRIAIADVSEYRLDFAKRLGVDRTFDPRDKEEREKALNVFAYGGPELVIVATGSASAFSDALRTVSKGGTLLLFGAPGRGASAQLDLGKFFNAGVTVTSSYAASEKEAAEAIKILESGSISVSDIVTHRFPLSEAPAAIIAAQKQKCVKAVVLD